MRAVIQLAQAQAEEERGKKKEVGKSFGPHQKYMYERREKREELLQRKGRKKLEINTQRFQEDFEEM